MAGSAIRRAYAWVAPALVVLAATTPGPALAYVGPGAGLTAIGTVFALFAAILLAVVGFVWYPIKRLFKRPAAGAGSAEQGRRPE